MQVIDSLVYFMLLMLMLPLITDDAEQHQYEEWLVHTQQLLQMQLKFLEEQIGAHRKSRKALCAKQRTAKKAGREFAEADAEKLKLVTEEQSKIQKQLDQVCKISFYKQTRDIVVFKVIQLITLKCAFLGT